MPISRNIINKEKASSLSYKVADIGVLNSQELYNIVSNKVSISISCGNISFVDNYIVNTSKIYGKSIFVTFEINIFGLYVPILEIDGKKINSVTDWGVQATDLCTLTIKDYCTENDISNFYVNTNASHISTKDMKVSGIYSINFDLGTISPIQLQNSFEKVCNLSPTINEDNVYSSEYLGEFLHFAGLMYFAHYDMENRLLAEQNQVYDRSSISCLITDFEKDIFIGIGNYATISNNGYFGIDVVLMDRIIASLTNNNDILREHSLATGMISSNLENMIWRELTGLEGISTTKVLTVAEENDIEIIAINNSNKDIELSKIINVIDDMSYNEIVNELNNNEHTLILIPSENVSVNEWCDTGYILLDTETGLSTYRLSEGINGGRTTTALANGISSATDNIVAMSDDTIKALGTFGDDAGDVAKIIDNNNGFGNTLAKNKDNIYQFAESTSKVTGSTIKSLEEFAEILTRYGNKNIYGNDVEDILADLINNYGSKEVKQATDTWGYKLIEEARKGNAIKVTEYINNPVPFDYNTLKNTNIFINTPTQNVVEHILVGNFDGTVSTGFHYTGMPNCKGIITTVRDTNTTYNIVKANVEIDGFTKKGISTFFPSNWTPQQIIDAINEAYNNAQRYKNTDLYRGKCNARFEIEMKIINNKVQTAYPSLGNF